MLEYSFEHSHYSHGQVLMLGRGEKFPSALQPPLLNACKQMNLLPFEHGGASCKNFECIGSLKKKKAGIKDNACFLYFLSTFIYDSKGN